MWRDVFPQTLLVLAALVVLWSIFGVWMINGRNKYVGRHHKYHGMHKWKHKDE